MMSTEAKREYQRVWRMKKRAEREAHRAQVLAKQQANAAKARAAKQARNGKPTLTQSEKAPAWGVGIKGNRIAFFIDEKVVFEHTFNQQEE